MDGFDRPDVRHQIAGGDEYEETNKQGGYIECHDDGDVELYWYCADVVAGGVEGNETSLLLHYDKTNADEVAPDEDRKSVV